MSQSICSVSEYNVIVIGCGHAGLEAGFIASRLCSKTAIITVSERNIGKLSCNPSVGGVSKSHLVCELSCLGGLMGTIADRAAVAAQMLSLSAPTKSLRLQVDKRLYSALSAQMLLKCGIQVIEAVATNIKCASSKFEIELAQLGTIRTKALVLAAGTFARSVCHVGACSLALDRLSCKSNDCIYSFLKAHGISLRRFKTGTSPRLEKSSICWLSAIKNKTSAFKYGFYNTLNRITLSMCCSWVRTNSSVYALIAANTAKTPFKLGQLLARGPKYCLSIEDKMLKFGCKPQKLIIEPEAIGANTVYINGLSTSMPIEVQLLMLKRICALKMRRLCEQVTLWSMTRCAQTTWRIRLKALEFVICTQLAK
ncbi:MAG: FAD-dependent oxidoreductase [Candidatus Hodgkinia cicadicola]